MASPSPTPLILLLLVALQLQSVIQARLLHPYELAVGRWDLTLHRRDRSLLESMVFPPKVVPHDTTTKEEKEEEGSNNKNNTSNTSSNIKQKSRTILPRFNKRKINCELCLLPDGTFILSPPPPSSEIETTQKMIQSKTEQEEEQILENQDTTIQSSKTALSSSSSSSPLKGRWRLKANPYCITDRHYDELTLFSNPKVRHISSKSKSTTTNNNAGEGDELSLELRCKIWGRYGSSTIRNLMNYKTGRDAGRMTHGILSIAQFHRGQDVEARRVVCATFRAKTITGGGGSSSSSGGVGGENSDNVLNGNVDENQDFEEYDDDDFQDDDDDY